MEKFDNSYKLNINEIPKIVSVENENAEKIQPNQNVKSRSRKQNLEMREFNDYKIRYHHETQPRNAITCEKCGKVFTRIDLLKEHKCGNCDKIEDPLNVALDDFIKTLNNFENISTNMSKNIEEC